MYFHRSKPWHQLKGWQVDKSTADFAMFNKWNDENLLVEHYSYRKNRQQYEEEVEDTKWVIIIHNLYEHQGPDRWIEKIK